MFAQLYACLLMYSPGLKGSQLPILSHALHRERRAV